MLILQLLTPEGVNVAMQEVLPAELRDHFLALGAEFSLHDSRFESRGFNEIENPEVKRGLVIISEWLLSNPSYHEKARDLAAEEYREWKRTVDAEQNWRPLAMPTCDDEWLNLEAN